MTAFDPKRRLADTQLRQRRAFTAARLGHTARPLFFANTVAVVLYIIFICVLAAPSLGERGAMAIRHVAGIALTACLLAGCASVVEGTTQPIAISTAPESGANCSVSNARGQWSAVSPGTVTVDKSESILTVRCSKSGWSDAVLYVAPHVSSTAMIGAFVPYVGIVDAAVNASSGAAMQYPEVVILTLARPVAPPAAH